MARTLTFQIPDDLEFIGVPVWTVETALETLLMIEQAQEADLAEFPGSPQENLVAAVLARAGAARRKLEAGELTVEAAACEIEAMQSCIREINRRAVEPDRRLGAAEREGMEKARATRTREHADRVAEESRLVAREVERLQALGLTRSTAVAHVAKNSGRTCSPVEKKISARTVWKRLRQQS